MNDEGFDVIITIVDKHYSEQVVQASKEAGAQGGTILHGRGTGAHETKKLLGIPIEPEKEIVLTVVPQRISDDVFTAIVRKAELDKPGSGIAFVVDAKKTAGIYYGQDEEQ